MREALDVAVGAAVGFDVSATVGMAVGEDVASVVTVSVSTVAMRWVLLRFW